MELTEDLLLHINKLSLHINDLKKISNKIVLVNDMVIKCKYHIDESTNRVEKTFATVLGEIILPQEDIENFKFYAPLINKYIENMTDLVKKIVNLFQSILLRFNNYISKFEFRKKDIASFLFITDDDLINCICKDLDTLTQDIIFYQNI